MAENQVIAFIQARLTSTRLPNKVLAKIGEWTAIQLMHLRLLQAKNVDKIVFVIPDNDENDRLDRYLVNDLMVDVVRGDENDVLSRFIRASRLYPAKYFVRLTADCPLICPELVDQVVEAAVGNNIAYASNTNPPTFPDGLDVECISKEALLWADASTFDPKIREHVTLGFRDSPKRPTKFKISNLSQDGIYGEKIRLTLDHPEDLRVFGILANNFGASLPTLNWRDFARFYHENNLYAVNGQRERNESLKKTL
jgi:spore coat polysaccharide biosynthesis protein SpsF (cytidylyltransferase family)